MEIVGCGVKNWGGLRPLPGARKSSPGNIFFPFHHVVFTHSHRQITNPGHETRHESSSRAGAKKMPIPEAGEVSSAECIGDLDQRSSTFTAVGTIFGFDGRIGSVGYPPGAGGGRRVGNQPELGEAGGLATSRGFADPGGWRGFIGRMHRRS